jgi:hypothetical protein
MPGDDLMICCVLSNEAGRSVYIYRSGRTDGAQQEQSLILDDSPCTCNVFLKKNTG